MYHRSSPGGGCRANTTFYGDLHNVGAFECCPVGGGNEGGLVSVSLAPQGKQGTS